MRGWSLGERKRCYERRVSDAGGRRRRSQTSFGAQMSGWIQLTTITGENPGEGVCLLLEIDEYRILLDCGWDHTLDTAKLEGLRDVIQTQRIDLVLISHADIEHLGALPYAVGKLGLACDIYVTLPVWRLGQIALYELYQSEQQSSNFGLDIMSLDDIDKAFESCIPLKYSQEMTIAGSDGEDCASGGRDICAATDRCEPLYCSLRV